MSDVITKLAVTIDGIAAGVESFKSDTAELRHRLEAVEANRMNPGNGIERKVEDLGALAAQAIDADLPSLEKHRTLRVELKAAGDPLTTGSVRSIVFGGIGAPEGQVLGIQFALPQRQLEAGTIVEYSRYTGVEGAAAQQVTEGSAKPGVTPTFAIVQQPALTFAGWTKVSRQALADQGEIRRVVNAVLSRSLNTAVDVGLVDGATGFAGGLEGLATASTSAIYEAVPDAVSEGIATMQVAGFSPDLVVLNPVTWLAVAVAKGELNDHYLAGDYLGVMPMQMRGVRVALSPSVDAGKALVIDTAHVELMVIGGTTLELGFDGNDFSRNLATMLIETRVAPVFRTVGAARLITPKA